MGNACLKDTGLPVLIIDEDEKETEYEYISYGSQGYVYAYDDKIAFKIFFGFDSDALRHMTFEKIKALAQFSDAQIAFPIGLVNFFEGDEVGYYMPRVKTDSEYPDFLHLKKSKSQLDKIDMLIKGEEPLKRAHANGIYFVDIKGSNILINEEGTPVFIDVDSASYGIYSHGPNLSRSQWFEKMYKRTLSLEDNDKFLYALLALQTLIRDNWYIEDINADFFNELIRKLDVSEDVKKELRYIFSNRRGKPYISELLNELDANRPLIKEENIKSLHKRI